MKPKVPTKAVCEEHLELRKEILTLLNLQKQVFSLSVLNSLVCTSSPFYTTLSLSLAPLRLYVSLVGIHFDAFWSHPLSSPSKKTYVVLNVKVLVEFF